MITVQVRKQGGAAIITIPADILKRLHIGIGTQIALEVNQKKMVARPLLKTMPKRYSLAELLKGTTPQKMKKLHQQTAWARSGKPIGRECA